MVNKYDLDTLHHILELKHKKIVKDNNINNKNLLNHKIIVWLNQNSCLEITKRQLKYQLWNSVNNQDLRLEVDLLDKMVLEEIENKLIDKILIKLKIKKRVEQSHNFYCDLCESWIYSNDYESLETVHNIKQHLPLEVD